MAMRRTYNGYLLVNVRSSVRISNMVLTKLEKKLRVIDLENVSEWIS
jgi:hypothetical protein